jgi:hypothetical protein
MHDSFFQQCVVGMFGFAFIIEVFIYSFGGQIVMDKSLLAAKNLNYIDKDLTIIIARAQKAEIIKSGFFEATLQTFSTMIRSAVSLITLLKSFMD